MTKCRQFQPFSAFPLAVTVGVGPDDELRCFQALLLPLGSAFEVVFLSNNLSSSEQVCCIPDTVSWRGRSCPLPNCAFAFLLLRKEASSLVDKCAGCWVVIRCSLRTSDVVGFCFQAQDSEQEVLLQSAIWRHSQHRSNMKCWRRNSLGSLGLCQTTADVTVDVEIPEFLQQARTAR